MTEEQRHKRHRRSIVFTYLLYKKTQRYMPPVARGLIGVVLICLGILGFLPILGFWMVPLGLAVLATDVPPLKRWFRNELKRHRKPKLKN